MSIIIPTYRRVDSTRRAIQSCLAQTYNRLEIIVVNDDLDDIKFEELKASFSHDPRVAFYSISHTGHPGKVRNAGIRYSIGEFVAFLDSDDYWNAKKIEIQMERMSDGEFDAVCTNAFISGTNQLLITSKIRKEITLWHLLSENLVVNSSVLIRRHLLIKVGGVVESGSVLGAEDYATWLRIATISSWGYISEGLVHYEAASSDSLKFSSEVSHLFSKTHGILDFIEWKKFNSGQMKVSRIFLRLIPNVVRAELFILRATQLGRGSNPEGVGHQEY